MRLRATDLVADAWGLWRGDRAALLGVAGLFWFLPAFALALLVPPPPAAPASNAPMMRQLLLRLDSLQHWIDNGGGWVLLGPAIGAVGTLAVLALYLDRTRPDVRGALLLGLALWPRFMLLSAMVGLMALVGLALWVLPMFWVLGRVMPAAPALLAERPLGAAAAVARGFGLSRGASLPLAALSAATLGLGWIAQRPLLALDGWLRGQPDGPNPVALMTVDAVAAAADTVVALATALLAVAAYRRLAGKTGRR